MTEHPETPAESLARAGRAQAAISGRADRFPKFLFIYGLGSMVMAVWTGFIAVSPISTIAFPVVWGGFVIAICLWVNGQRANLRGMGQRHAIYIGTQMAVFFPVLFIGLGFEQDLRYWLPVSPLVALPIFIGAAYEAHRLRTARDAA